MPSQSSQARNPPGRPNGPSHGMLVTPDSRPMTATSPRFWKRNGGDGLAAQAAQDRLGGVLAGLDPALGDAGHGPVSAVHGCTAASPSTKISGWPGIVRSGPTRIRPVRSVSAPAAAATVRAERRREHARRPQHGARRDLLLAVRRDLDRDRVLVDVGRPSSPSGPCTPSRSSWRAADADGSGG